MKILLLFSALIIFGIYSCSHKIGRAESTKVFQDIVRKNPLFCSPMEKSPNECLICGVVSGAQEFKSCNGCYEFITLDYFGNKWYEKASKNYGSDFEYIEIIDSFKVTTIDKHQYIYFLSKDKEMGTIGAEISTLRFNLFDPTINRLYTLNYEGTDKTDSLIDGNFLNIDSLSSFPSLLNYLEDKVKNCKFIYRPNKEDLDINNPKNFEKKWEVDNPDFPSLIIKGVPIDSDEIPNMKFTFYSGDLFSFYDQEHTGKVVESGMYKILYFNIGGDIIGYDKNQKKYFPIWVIYAATIANCCNDITFINDYTIKIGRSDGASPQKGVLNLKNGNYKIMSGN
jgi:hypothetical protein